VDNQQVSTLSNLYLERYAYPEQLNKKKPFHDLGIVVTIPCYNETNLLVSLQSLKHCTLPQCSVEVIVIINNANNAQKGAIEQNKITFIEATAWAEINSTNRLSFSIYWKAELPPKHAGVGLARKIAMDEAVRRFELVENANGLIVCFDADSQCELNYLVELEQFFKNHPKCPGCSIYFEHPLAGDEEPDIYQAITDYELFLRYYVNALKFSGFPYAYQTIGSSMAVRSNVYQQQGGMNKKKAGEDFYFLHKIIPLGHFGEVKTTKITPSPRQSDRVPFGTGKAVNEWLTKGHLDTYNFNTFIDLKAFYEYLNSSNLYCNTSGIDQNELPKSISEFLITIDFKENVKRIQKNSASEITFIDNFHRWFDGFKVLKYVHFARDHFYNKEPITIASSRLYNELGTSKSEDAKSLLLQYRQLDRLH
jgi:hypothetical protein